MPRGETQLERLAFRWCAVAVVAGVALALFDVHHTSGAEGLRQVGVHAATSLLVVGKFIVFAGLQDDALSPRVLAIMVWLIDLCFAVCLASGLESLERAPVLGRWLRRARRRAVEVIARYPGLERMAFLGVVAFVMLPLAATGAISGSFAARMLGLTRIAGVLAIAIGSAITAAAFALLATFLGERGEELVRSPVLVGTTVFVLVILGRWAWVRIVGRLR